MRSASVATFFYVMVLRVRDGIVRVHISSHAGLSEYAQILLACADVMNGLYVCVFWCVFCACFLVCSWEKKNIWDSGSSQTSKTSRLPNGQADANASLLRTAMEEYDLKLGVNVITLRDLRLPFYNQPNVTDQEWTICWRAVVAITGCSFNKLYQPLVKLDGLSVIDVLDLRTRRLRKEKDWARLCRGWKEKYGIVRDPSHLAGV